MSEPKPTTSPPYNQIWNAGDHVPGARERAIARMQKLACEPGIGGGQRNADDKAIQHLGAQTSQARRLDQGRIVLRRIRDDTLGGAYTFYRAPVAMPASLAANCRRFSLS